jgi:hypothetical protein
LAKTADTKQQLIIQHAGEMLENSKLAAGIRTRLLELLDRASARQHDRNLELARYREAARQREHELAKLRTVSDTDFAARVNEVIDARLQKERNGAK